MINRYVRPVMADIWSDMSKYNAWLQVELAACRAWNKLGVIPNEDMLLLEHNATVNIPRIAEIEAETRHDVIAFTRALSESLGDERKWVHYGLTSTDVVDTAQGVLLKQANAVIKDGVTKVMTTLKNKAKEHKHTVMIGRTHGVHAEPTTFGLKMALWYTEMERNLARFDAASKSVEFGKVSGAVGTYANVDPQVEQYVCEELGLSFSPISTQVLQRDRHAEYMSALAILATSLDKFCTEIRSLQRTEILEVEEPFKKGQKGSSAMPHKKNPIGCEGICGLARVVRGYVTPALEDMVLWNERDISHSSVERIILPDATTLVDYMLNRFNNIVKDLVVNKQNMTKNIDKTHGVIFSGRVLTSLIDKGFSREQAYDLVQSLALQTWKDEVHLRDLIKTSKDISKMLSVEEIESCFDVRWHLTHVDTIFDRLQF